MTITQKYNFKVEVNQFGRKVDQYFQDNDEILLIEEFEKGILNLKKQNQSFYSMIELGSNQAYYSCMFKAMLRDFDTQCIMVEKQKPYMERGINHFKLNGFDGEFLLKEIGKDSSVDELIEKYNLSSLDVLHCDLDENEVIMLEGAVNSLKNKVIKSIFLLTHSEELHDECLNILTNFDYNITLNHAPHHMDHHNNRINFKHVGADYLIIANA